MCLMGGSRGAVGGWRRIGWGGSRRGKRDGDVRVLPVIVVVIIIMGGIASVRLVVPWMDHLHHLCRWCYAADLDVPIAMEVGAVVRVHEARGESQLLLARNGLFPVVPFEIDPARGPLGGGLGARHDVVRREPHARIEGYAAALDGEVHMGT